MKNKKHFNLLLTISLIAVALIILTSLLVINQFFGSPKKEISIEKTEKLFKEFLTKYNQEIYLSEKEIIKQLQKELNIYIESALFNEGLKRKEKYGDLIYSIFKKHNIHTDFIYVAFVESIFNPDAYNNNSGAKGLWQLMPDTARSFGLRVNDQIDERSDPAKSTTAAARYLKYLQGLFGRDNLPLVLAAYNAGEGRIQRIIKDSGSTVSAKSNFWKLYTDNLLPGQTKVFVRRVITFMLLTENRPYLEAEE